MAAVGDEEAEEGVTVSSPNSAVSSFQMDFGMYRNGRGNKRDFEATVNGGSHQEVDTVERASSRGINSDEEDVNGLLARKKLRLTKDQSAFLEESFKEHNTLNPVSHFFFIYIYIFKYFKRERLIFSYCYLFIYTGINAETKASSSKAVESSSTPS